MPRPDLPSRVGASLVGRTAAVLLLLLTCANLRAIGYDKRISVEGSTQDLAADGPKAIALLHRAFEQ